MYIFKTLIFIKITLIIELILICYLNWYKFLIERYKSEDIFIELRGEYTREITFCKTMFGELKLCQTLSLLMILKKINLLKYS